MRAHHCLSLPSRRLRSAVSALCLACAAVAMVLLPAAGGIVGGGGAVAGAATPAATCKQLTKAQVQPVMSMPITKVKVTKALSTGQQCVYSDAADDGKAVDVLVIGGSEAKSSFQEDVRGLDSKVAVPGVGQKTYRAKGDFQISSTNGKEYCSVSVGSTDTIPGAAAIEEQNGGTSELSESDNAAIAQALGTICNRLYKKGNTKVSLAALGTTTATTTASGGSAGGKPIGTTQSTKTSSEDPEKVTAGMRWVGLDFTVIVEGPDSLAGAPFVIGSDGMTYGFNSAEIIGPVPGCTSTGNDVPQGKPQTLCAGTMMPNGVTVSKVVFSGLQTTQSGTGVLYWSGS
jgi:hypothetical protein